MRRPRHQPGILPKQIRAFGLITFLALGNARGLLQSTTLEYPSGCLQPNAAMIGRCQVFLQLRPLSVPAACAFLVKLPCGTDLGLLQEVVALPCC